MRYQGLMAPGLIPPEFHPYPCRPKYVSGINYGTIINSKRIAVITFNVHTVKYGYAPVYQKLLGFFDAPSLMDGQ
jgi:hypothetical protein